MIAAIGHIIGNPDRTYAGMASWITRAIVPAAAAMDAMLKSPRNRAMPATAAAVRDVGQAFANVAIAAAAASHKLL